MVILDPTDNQTDLHVLVCQEADRMIRKLFCFVKVNWKQACSLVVGQENKNSVLVKSQPIESACLLSKYDLRKRNIWMC